MLLSFGLIVNAELLGMYQRRAPRSGRTCAFRRQRASVTMQAGEGEVELSAGKCYRKLIALVIESGIRPYCDLRMQGHRAGHQTKALVFWSGRASSYRKASLSKVLMSM